MTQAEVAQLQANVKDNRATIKQAPLMGELKPAKVRQKRANNEIKLSGMDEQLVTTEIMDAVACFSMNKNFIHCHYDINRIVATHQSGVTVTIDFK